MIVEIKTLRFHQFFSCHESFVHFLPFPDADLPDPSSIVEYLDHRLGNVLDGGTGRLPHEDTSVLAVHDRKHHHTDPREYITFPYRMPQKIVPDLELRALASINFSSNAFDIPIALIG